jgi:hypothetical protein
VNEDIRDQKFRKKKQKKYKKMMFFSADHYSFWSYGQKTQKTIKICIFWKLFSPVNSNKKQPDVIIKIDQCAG